MDTRTPEPDWNDLPPGAVSSGLTIAEVTDQGDLKCPVCGTTIITPMGLNPKNGREEKYILNAGVSMQCHVCWSKNNGESATNLIVTKPLAKKHNHFWYPDDPEFK